MSDAADGVGNAATDHVGTAGACGAAGGAITVGGHRPRRVVVAVPSGVHLLDLAGPAQVFSAATDLGARYEWSFVGERSSLPSHQGLGPTVDTSWPDRVDLVVVPGHRTDPDPPRSGLPASLLDRLRAHHDDGGITAAVCSGAFALAEAGLLDGRRATTHHELADMLARRHPRVQVVRDVLYVVDGPIVTSAGVASGVDVALHLVAADHGPALAARVARALVLPSRRGGADAQDSLLLRHRDHLHEAVHRAQDVLDARFTEAVPLHELAAAVGVGARTLTRRFRSVTGISPLRYQQALRLDRADALLALGWTADAAARAVGFTDGRMVRRLRAARRARCGPAPGSTELP